MSEMDFKRNNFIMKNSRKKFMIGEYSLISKKIVRVMTYNDKNYNSVNDFLSKRSKNTECAIFCMDNSVYRQILVSPVKYRYEVISNILANVEIIERPTCIYSNDGIIGIIDRKGELSHYRWRGLSDKGRMLEFVTRGIVNKGAMELEELPYFIEPEWDEHSGLKHKPRVRI